MENWNRTAWAEIDLSALRRNFEFVRGKVAPGTLVWPVLKCDAYGHGAVEAARSLADAGASAIAVATVDEGVRLRETGLELPILLLDYMLEESAVDAVAHNLTPTVHTAGALLALDKAACSLGKTVSIHVRVNTLPGSMGLDPKQLGSLIEVLTACRAVRAEGMFTHLTAAYRGDHALVRMQIGRLRSAAHACKEAGVPFAHVHAASSPAILSMPESYLDAVRPGTMLYGLPSLEDQEMSPLRGVMCLKARITHVEEHEDGFFVGYGGQEAANGVKRIATVALGYGAARFLLTQKGGEVLVGGRRAPILGTARMASLLVDVSGAPSARVGDEVVIFGRQGDDEITVAEAAARAGIDVVQCESLCMLCGSVPRIYHNGEAAA